MPALPFAGVERTTFLMPVPLPAVRLDTLTRASEKVCARSFPLWPVKGRIRIPLARIASISC